MKHPVSTLAALLCALSVAGGAYASHVAAPEAMHRIGLASLFAFGHGLALIALAPRSSSVARWGRAALLAGTVLFSGSLAAAAFFGTSTAAAPTGGTLLIIGWLIVGYDFVRN